MIRSNYYHVIGVFQEFFPRNQPEDGASAGENPAPILEFPKQYELFLSQ
jgi:hypothetical protein